jgi:hypothetical protein
MFKQPFRISPIVLMVFMVFAFYGCKWFKKGPDVSGINVQIDIQRFEQDLFSIPYDSIDHYIPKLQAQYPRFIELFNRIIRIGQPNTPTYSNMLIEFLTFYDVQQAYSKVQQVFPDLSGYNENFTQAFKRYKYYFPDRLVPEMFSYVAGFQNSILIGDSLMAIGLDNYLGADCDLYKRLGIQQYIIKKMRPEMIVPDAINSWLKTEFLFNDSINNVLSNMVYLGKLYYATQQLLPNHADSLIMGFTANQMQFCKNNEDKMWTFLVEHNKLFSTDHLTINRFISEGPFTRDFTNESPARAVTWIGWQIVESYMQRNDVDLYSLMKDGNYIKIFNNAGYAP